MSNTYVAFLRGINVGGKNKVPMKRLVEIFAEAGCKDVRTYIQSGNVVFRCAVSVAVRVPSFVSERIENSLRLRTPIVLRSRQQVAEVVANNPLLGRGAPEEQLHVLFLADAPEAARIEGLDPNRSSPDAFVVRGREIFLQLPNGVARTKLSNAYFDSKLATASTGRNWRTVTKLHEMIVESRS